MIYYFIIYLYFLEVLAMTTLLFSFNMGLQKRFAPLPLNFHIVLCLAVSVIFILLYLRYHKVKDILWMVAFDMILILQFYGDERTAIVIGIFELILLTLIFLEYLKEQKALRAKKAAEAAAEKAAGDTAEEDNLDDVAKAVKAERSKLAPDSGTDMISQAFDNEDIDR
mgnify:FL=1